ncbi:DUF6691 family protein [Maritimibacter fusiformis]|uniref:YeeE/YedE family protein n=1 Tax=Maritimibacter fusiformis TaxID=2603819 RepID=A0A5D0RKY6_9RHOB|nr:DUF6691 family protein [Maritimibacter fusiformis]TYB81445.1 YeeE/YedE family protein [Maritimibacter fusiformis]
MRLFLIYLAGLGFGVGIAISGMMNPAKVLNFFDFAGIWDPTLLVVMVSALVVTAIGYRLVFRRERPLFSPRFQVPTSRTIDAKLVGGAAVFGIGWGISGFCPGAALPALGTGDPAVLIFVGAMILGILLARAAIQRSWLARVFATA